MSEQLWGSAAQPLRELPPAIAAWQFKHVPEEEIELHNARRAIKRELEDSFLTESAALAKQMRGNFINMESKANKDKRAVVQLGGSASNSGFVRDVIDDIQSMTWWQRELSEKHAALVDELGGALFEFESPVADTHDEEAALAEEAHEEPDDDVSGFGGDLGWAVATLSHHIIRKVTGFKMLQVRGIFRRI